MGREAGASRHGEAGSAAARAADPLVTGQEHATAVQRMFGAVAPRYDLLNHLLSLNIDRAWRRRAVDRLLAAGRPDGTYLDSCAGTLDLSVELAGRASFHGRVIACDFSLPMLAHGLGKIGQRSIHTACADALQLPIPDASIDGAMVGFGIRNVASLDAGLAEFARVLRPGAPLVILEFTTPGWQPFRALYLLYFQRILPFIGRVIARQGEAYAYLPVSVKRFPGPEVLAADVEAAGFTDVRWEALTGGIAAIHTGVRNGRDGRDGQNGRERAREAQAQAGQ